MKKRLIGIVFLFMFTVAITGCSNNSENIKDAQIDPENIIYNTSLFEKQISDFEGNEEYTVKDMVSLMYYNKDITYLGVEGYVYYAFDTEDNQLFSAGYVPDSTSDTALFKTIFDELIEKFGDFTALENTKPVDSNNAKNADDALKKIIGKKESYFQFEWQDTESNRSIEISYLTGTFSVIVKNKAS